MENNGEILRDFISKLGIWLQIFGFSEPTPAAVCFGSLKWPTKRLILEKSL